jgi:O-antigen ligase
MLLAWLVALKTGFVRWRRATINAATAAYVLLSFAAVAFSRDPSASVREVGELAAFLLVPIAVSLLDLERWDRLVKILTGVAMLSAGCGIWQYLHGANDLSNRLHGLNNHYMTFAGWTLLIVLLLLGDIVFSADRRRLFWTLPTFFLCSLTLLLSFTRSAWVGLAVGLSLVAVLWRPKAVLLYVVLIALLVVCLPQSVVSRAVSIFDPHDESNYDRLCMVRSGLQMTADYPVFGVGLGMVQVRYSEYRAEDAHRKKVPHLHNNLIQIAAERGLAGLATYLAILVVFGIHTCVALMRSKGPESPALAGCFLAIAGITVAGMFEYNWGDAEVGIVTLVCLAAPFALSREGE